MSWKTLLKRYSKKVQTWEKKMLPVTLQSRDIRIQQKHLHSSIGLTTLERSYDVCERYVEESIKFKEQMFYG